MNSRKVYNMATLKESANCNAENDAKTLYSAMKGIGTNEDALIEVLAYRSCDQRLEIRDKYCGMYGKKLKDTIHGETSGSFRRVLEALLMDGATFAAYSLYLNMKGAGTDEDSICEILCTATNEEIHDIKEAYLEVLKSEGIKDPSRTLESDCESEISGHFKRLIIAILQGNREELTAEQINELRTKGLKHGFNFGNVAQDFNDLYNAGEGKLGTDETTFIRICGSRSAWHMRVLNQFYENKTGKTLIEAIKSETSGDFRKALSMTVSMCVNGIQTFAKLLYQAMDGAGTRDNTLIHIIVTRCEIDLGAIRHLYEQEYECTLEESIRGDTSGHYRKILLALLGAEWRG